MVVNEKCVGKAKDQYTITSAWRFVKSNDGPTASRKSATAT